MAFHHVYQKVILKKWKFIGARNDLADSQLQMECCVPVHTSTVAASAIAPAPNVNPEYGVLPPMNISYQRQFNSTVAPYISVAAESQQLPPPRRIVTTTPMCAISVGT